MKVLHQTRRHRTGIMVPGMVARSFLWPVVLTAALAGWLFARDAAGNKPPAGKEACLECHGPFPKLVEKTNGYKTESGESVTPHRFIPHDSVDDKAIPECLKCHPRHPPNPSAEDLAKLKKPDLEFCFKCHHTRDFTPCKTCHP